jgi:ABC-type multidrug transport system fused ATPase/permease subunit
MKHLMLDLFSRYHLSIVITYALTFLENIFELLYPFIIGITIDGLLQGNYQGLITLAIVWSIHTITEVGRNIYDTYTFTQIYNHLAIEVVLRQFQQGIPTSQIVARSALSREFVDFFELDLPGIITALFGLVGALIMLAFYDLQIASYCLVLLLPIVPLNITYARKSLLLNHHLNNQLESEVDILMAGQPENVGKHYTTLANYRIKISNNTAINWGIMEIFTIILFMVILIRTVSLSSVQPGDIYAIISYAWNYRQSLDIIPVLVQQLSRLQDISDRL